jgi:hypothetical protein
MTKYNPTSNTQELKRLQSLQSQLKLEFRSLHENTNRIKMELMTKEKQIKEVEKKIQNLQGCDENIIVSEHAIVRYLERVYGLDLEKIKHEIIPEKTITQAKMVGNGRYKVDDYTLLIKDNVVITVIKNDNEMG